MNITLCTLFESNYHFGVAALANSLAASGYRGNLWVGHRDALPRWMVEHPQWSPERRCLEVAPGLWLRALALDTPLYLNYYKPVLMRELLERHEPDAQAVVYLDPDIVVKCPWHVLEDWLGGDGIALAEDVHGYMPSRHPKRLQWQRFFEGHGLEPRRQLERCFNSGFVGVPRSRMALLDHWRRACELIVAHLDDPRHLKVGGPASLFHSTDEDALNFALSLDDSPILAAGPEAMDFVPGGNLLSHAVGSLKPWHGRQLRQALVGRPPSAACQQYWRYANAPLAPWGTTQLLRRRLSLGLASALGRVYRPA